MRIGVFDSGYGGLTILSEIRRIMPEYDYIYLGDNARAPYGTRSFDIIHRYTWQAVRYLLRNDCALVILACNTASAKALRTIQQRDLPLINSRMANGKTVNVLGVIRPTVEAVPAITRTGHVGILATPATVSSESYVLELGKTSSPAGSRLPAANFPALTVTQQSCPLWVPLIESGEHTRPGADYFVNLYLRELMAKDPLIDTLVLGCTHYPLLLPKINNWIQANHPASDEGRGGLSVISQGTLVAASLKDYLVRHPEYAGLLSHGGTCTYLTTEDPERFSQSASRIFSDQLVPPVPNSQNGITGGIQIVAQMVDIDA